MERKKKSVWRTAKEETHGKACDAVLACPAHGKDGWHGNVLLHSRAFPLSRALIPQIPVRHSLPSACVPCCRALCLCRAFFGRRTAK